ncbi:polymerase delta-interacting protein 3-like protein [Leptotrombidium deliense]|uniref:Polymerase delta-interacting protein 3-like protein n=1 Tax=Leptotrombidium deliense TaxID=299467 RepID=A0A443SGR8_9ACAR|nr:polymerase delta-interacting protein 3-like protein [Leptotrombidium deliense]
MKGRRFAAKGANKQVTTGKRVIRDLREVINNQRGTQQSSNVRSRLGLSMKAKSRGLQSKAARNRQIGERRPREGRLVRRPFMGGDSNLPRVFIKNNGNVVSQSPCVILAPSSFIPGAVNTLPLSVNAAVAAPAPQVGATVLITNLNSTITDTDLLELFGDVGEMSSLQMVNSSTALVTYSNASDASKACETYNNRLLDGYPMSCTVLPPTGGASQPVASSTRGLSRPSSSFAHRTTAAQAFIDSGLLPRRPRKDVQFTVKI